MLRHVPTTARRKAPRNTRQESVSARHIDRIRVWTWIPSGVIRLTITA
jgi:hypothetical protein